MTNNNENKKRNIIFSIKYFHLKKYNYEVNIKGFSLF